MNSIFFAKNQNLVKIFVTASAAVLASIFLSGAAFAQVGNDTIAVDVTIASVSEITVTPTTLAFTTNPGTADTEVSIDIRNTGSLNVSRLQVYANTLDLESIRPYGNASRSHTLLAAY